MKKIVSSVILLLLFLIPSASDASYRILLKNGGQVATPLYWYEGRFVFFQFSGGVAGVERKAVARVLGSEEMEKQGDGTVVLWNPGKKEPPPEPPAVKDAQAQEKPAELKKEEKVDFAVYKERKDRMKAQMEGYLEKLREAAATGDNDAKTKIKEEMLKISQERDKLTEEVKGKNRGRLPDGW
ncbi:MAG: hypothetical protein ACYDAA_01300 [Syntrophales bacterium]